MLFIRILYANFNRIFTVMLWIFLKIFRFVPVFLPLNVREETYALQREMLFDISSTGE